MSGAYRDRPTLSGRPRGSAPACYAGRDDASTRRGRSHPQQAVGGSAIDITPLDAAETAICAVVRGTPDVWRGLTDPAAQSAFLAAARRHRLQPLLAWQLRERSELTSWPDAIRQPLLNAERAEAALEIVRRAELDRVLPAFAAARVELVLFKGAAFAYSLYPEPWLRPREDTDAVIRFADAAAAGRILTDAGFQPLRMTRGEIVTHQRTYLRTDRAGLRHEWDLHWKIANPVAFADLIPADTLIAASVPLRFDDAGVIARMPARVHALALACLHRVSHHHDTDDLIWLYDIHLLAGRLTPREANELVELARRIGAGAICARGLRLAQARFETTLPPSLVADLDTPADGAPALPSTYFGGDSRKIDHLRADLAAIPGWGRKWRLVREHLFPPADYMLSRYPGSSRLMLPAFYLWRILAGARGWFRSVR